MSQPDFEDLKLVGYHEPDFSMEPQPDGTKAKRDLPGHYHVGIMVDGVFRRIDSFKAAKFMSRREQARKSQGEQPQQPDQQQQG